MLLYSETFGVKAKPSQPTLVFLHGLLGSGQDWRTVIAQLSNQYQCITIDLPGHGLSALVEPSCGTNTVTEYSGFESVHQALLATLAHRNISDYVLIGYSMGARLAMFHAMMVDIKSNDSVFSLSSQVSQSPRLTKVLLEGGHFGLPETERAERYQNDQQWAAHFSREPLVTVLQDWYQQSVFASLTTEQRQHLVLKRSDNLGAGIATMLLATSLAKQPQMLPILQKISLPIRYLCGEKDQKFKQLAIDSKLDFQVIKDAGHNIHIEQPVAFAHALLAFVNE